MPNESDVRVFKVRVSKSGEISAEQTPKQEGDIESANLMLGPHLQKTIEFFVGFLRDNRLHSRDEYEFLGESLYSVLFMDSEGKENRVGQALLRAVNEETNARLRIELEFDDNQEMLASWPWEYLFCPERQGVGGLFLATLARLVMTRHLRLPGLAARPMRVDEKELPLRILFVAASPEPEEDELKPVQFERILEEIEELAKSPRITVSKLIPPSDSALPPVATFENFYEAAFNLEPHVIHFVGHGRCGDGGGQLAFMGLDRKPDYVSDKDFANLLRQIHSVRLVFLQACESALRDPYQAVSGVAMRLSNVNIPAVVAMQYQIEQQVASRFAREFYTALSNNETIDGAVQRARSNIWVRVRDWDRSRTFGLPVLYQREAGALLVSQRAAQTPMQSGAGTGIVESSKPSAGGALLCPWCGSAVDAEENFCSECDGQLVCTSEDQGEICDTRVQKKRLSCRKCGSPLRHPD